MKITYHARLLMIGDSITDCGRARPIGEGHYGELGSGYVSLVDALLTAAYPSEDIVVLNAGIGGETVRDLVKRWQQDVISLKPEWLSIMIGTNDVWRSFDEVARDRAVPLPEYTQTLEQLVRDTLPLLPGGLILMTPFFIETDTQDPMRIKMNQYGAAVREIAEKYHTLFVDTQAAFDGALKYLPSSVLANDRVHPSLPGHMVLARAFMQAIDFHW